MVSNDDDEDGDDAVECDIDVDDLALSDEDRCNLVRQLGRMARDLMAERYPDRDVTLCT